MKFIPVLIGSLSVIIILYRIVFLMIPMFREGIQTKNVKQMFESLTMLV